MAIKRYAANADTTITNAFKTNLTDRGTGSNMGLSDTLEVFSLYGQSSGSEGYTQELSRVLLKFPTDIMSSDRSEGSLPNSGSVSFFLKLYNAEHGYTLPRNAIYNIVRVVTDWEEGHGLDMETYLDEVKGGTGSTWIDAKKGVQWTTIGGDYLDTPDNYYKKELYRGDEDLEIEITGMVEGWLSDGNANYGLGVHLTSSQESYYSSSTGLNTNVLIHNPDGSQTSYYTKKFFARDSEFFFKRPVIEARWDSSRHDDRGQTYFSSSLMSGEDNLNTLYLYNYVRGRLKNIPNLTNGVIWLSLYSGSVSGSDVYVPTGSKIQLPVGGGVVTNLDVDVTGGIVATGIYTASFALTSSVPKLEKVFDVWHYGGNELFSASFSPKTLPSYQTSPNVEWVSSVTNLKDKYTRSETARIRLFTRVKGWQPNIWTKASVEPELTVVNSASYEIFRATDLEKVIPFGTGSNLHTLMSYDASGSYFDLDMSLLEGDTAYGIRFAFYDEERNTWDVQKTEYKFRVIE